MCSFIRQHNATGKRLYFISLLRGAINRYEVIYLSLHNTGLHNEMKVCKLLHVMYITELVYSY